MTEFIIIVWALIGLGVLLHVAYAMGKLSAWKQATSAMDELKRKLEDDPADFWKDGPNE